QVPLDEKRVRRIVAEFDPLLLAPLTISRRSDDSLVILDGQHRWMALVELSWKAASCEVLQGLNLPQEAHIFAERNLRRRTPSKSYAYRARALAGDPDCTAMFEAVRRFGFELVTNRLHPGRQQLTCPDAVLKAQRLGTLEKALRTIKEAWATDSRANRGEVLLGLAAFYRVWPEASVENTVRKLADHSAREVVERGHRMREFSGDARHWANFARTVCAIYNVRRPQGRLDDRRIGARALPTWFAERRQG
ncbi:MAG: DUF6551 family protein, partial [Solirubrobacteraceae bacterium]